MGRLKDDVTRLGGEIGALRSSREVFIRDLRHGISELKAGAQKMQPGFRSEHADMSRNMIADFLDFISKLKEFVLEMAEDVSNMQSGFRKAHAKMAAETKGERERLLSEFGQSSNVLRQEIAGFRREFAVDTARAWFGHFPVGTAAAETKKIETPYVAEALKSRADDADELQTAKVREGFMEADEAATVDDVILNDFTVIAGIGPAREGRLNKAGYYTFAQLAKSTPEKLREILGGSARSANVENWIEDARDLAQ
jgi:predicted flap endonuclease-1-like 5' DNA nuclease